MKKFLFFLILSFTVMGCTKKYLVYAQDSSLGFDLHAAPTEGNIRFSVGYDRNSFSIIPKLENGEDAMSMVGINRVYVKGIDKFQFAHAFATGEAAERLVENPSQLKKLAKKIFVDSVPSAKNGGNQ